MQKKQKLLDEQNQSKPVLESLLPEDRFFNTKFNRSIADHLESVKQEDVAQISVQH